MVKLNYLTLPNSGQKSPNYSHVQLAFSSSRNFFSSFLKSALAGKVPCLRFYSTFSRFLENHFLVKISLFIESEIITILSFSKEPTKFFKITNAVLFSGHLCSLMSKFNENGNNLPTLELKKNSRFANSTTTVSIYQGKSLICKTVENRYMSRRSRKS